MADCVRSPGGLVAQEAVPHALDDGIDRRKVNRDLIVEAAAIGRLRQSGVQRRRLVVQGSSKVSHTCSSAARARYGYEPRESCQGIDAVLRSRAFAKTRMAMNRRHSSVRICPDCGGILQPTRPETLTTAEVAASDSPRAGERAPVPAVRLHGGAAARQRAGAVETADAPNARAPPQGARRPETYLVTASVKEPGKPGPRRAGQTPVGGGQASGGAIARRWSASLRGASASSNSSKLMRVLALIAQHLEHRRTPLV